VRIAITGIGVVSAIGCGRTEFRENLLEGVGAIESTALPDGTLVEAALIKGFDLKNYVEAKKVYLDRNSALAMGATVLAMREAGCKAAPVNPARLGLSTATTFGNMATAAAFHQKLVEKGPRLAPPLIFPHAYANATNSLLSIEFGVRGPNCNFNSGFTAGAHAIAWAAGRLAEGRADAFLAGGTEALCPEILLGGLSDGIFGSEGFAPGEAAAMLFMETEISATKRSATPLAFIKGMGFSSGSLDSVASAIDRAVRAAGISARTIDVAIAGIRASGRIDCGQVEAMRKVLPADCPIIAPQVFTGATFAVSAPIDVIIAALAASDGRYPPPIKLVDGEIRVTEEAINKNAVNTAVVSVDPNGDAVALVIGG